jgi:hypothetical protein
MLVARCTIENEPDGRWTWRALLVDQAHTFELTEVRTPKREVAVGAWRPPHRSYTTVRGAVASIKRLAKRLPARVGQIHLCAITWGESESGKPIRSNVERRFLR